MSVDDIGKLVNVAVTMIAVVLLSSRRHRCTQVSFRSVAAYETTTTSKSIIVSCIVIAIDVDLC